MKIKETTVPVQRKFTIELTLEELKLITAAIGSSNIAGTEYTARTHGYVVNGKKTCLIYNKLADKLVELKIANK